MHEVLPIPEECPWSTWARPNLRWCEQMTCGYIVTPLNAWSNLFLLFAGLAMYSVKHEGARPSRRTSTTAVAYENLPWTTVFLAVCSFAFHASYTYFFQYWDFVGMFVALAGPLASSLVRSGVVSPLQARVAFWACGIIPSLLVPVLATVGVKYQGLVLVMILTILFLERASFVELLPTLSWLVAAFAASASDQTGLICEPGSWWQGHSFWHFGCGMAIYYMFGFYGKKEGQLKES